MSSISKIDDCGGRDFFKKVRMVFATTNIQEKLENRNLGAEAIRNLVVKFYDSTVQHDVDKGLCLIFKDENFQVWDFRFKIEEDVDGDFCEIASLQELFGGPLLEASKDFWLKNVHKTFERKHVKIAEAHFSGEEGFYGAYLNQLAIAKKLFDQGVPEFYIVAYTELLTSIECFFKDIFCHIRTEVINLNGGRNNLINGNIQHLLPSNFEKILDRNLTAKDRFSHNLSSLADFISSQITGLKTNGHFLQLTAKLPPTADWINERYSHPNNSKTDYKKEFNNLEKAFNGLLSSVLGRFK